MSHPADFIPAIDDVLARIKGNHDKAQVRELQREYRKLERGYAKAARDAWAAAPLGPCEQVQS